jgi:predicted nuclease of predicted toxin-antitoxin system
MSERLLLDEHFPALIAERLRQAGFDVQAVAEDSALTGPSDEELYRIALARRRRLVTENVQDFRPLLVRAVADGHQAAPLLLTTAARHPRHLEASGSQVAALTDWLSSDDPPKTLEEWL